MQGAFRQQRDRARFAGLLGELRLVEARDEDHARTEAARIGYPVMLKSTAGGGGIGMSLLRRPDELSAAFTSVGRARFLNVHAPSCGFADYLLKVDAGEKVDAELYDLHPLD